MWKQVFVETARGRFEIFTQGEGEPLCVTHFYSEFNETGDYFAETFIRTNKVILVNLREAGNSVKSSQPYDLSLLETVLDLEAIREALGLRKWGFAGHSTGGMLGVVYGIYYSGKLTFSVIVGAAAREYMTFSPECIYNEEHPHFNKMQKLIEELKRSDLPLQTRRELTKERTKLSLFQPERYDEIFPFTVHKKMSSIRLNYFSRELQVFDVTRKLQLISVPTLIICGKYDVQCPLTYSLEMNELIPSATLIIFTKSNHYPFLEEPDRFSAEIKTFIKEVI
ncbi:alpha/beta fold hydrolase [Peribacillus sp. B-H-3]|uniref:alpha/beta fold hydrolase n=1 Tax=Peribacillus sp. B-H-3 TaxID=3400420 RepID=UPI003B028073